jgi:hypothetical protein
VVELYQKDRTFAHTERSSVPRPEDHAHAEENCMRRPRRHAPLTPAMIARPVPLFCRESSSTSDANAGFFQGTPSEHTKQSSVSSWIPTRALSRAREPSAGSGNSCLRASTSPGALAAPHLPCRPRPGLPRHRSAARGGVGCRSARLVLHAAASASPLGPVVCSLPQRRQSSWK